MIIKHTVFVEDSFFKEAPAARSSALIAQARLAAFLIEVARWKENPFGETSEKLTEWEQLPLPPRFLSCSEVRRSLYKSAKIAAKTEAKLAQKTENCSHREQANFAEAPERCSVWLRFLVYAPYNRRPFHEIRFYFYGDTGICHEGWKSIGGPK